MTQDRAAIAFDDPGMSDTAEIEAASGGPAPSVVDDFARLRIQLLSLIAGRAPGDDGRAGAIRRQMGLSDRAFGELWAACSCNGDFAPGRRRR